MTRGHGALVFPLWQVSAAMRQNAEPGDASSMSNAATFGPRAALRRAYATRSAAVLAKAAFFSLLLLAGCATFNKPVNVPVAAGASPMPQFLPPDVGGDTAVALAFSGGGTRAAAFSFGVLRGLDRVQTRGGKSYLERVIFVSGVSGGSITAAYYGLKGRAALADFRERFLIRDGEENLNTTVSLGNLARGLDGGVNDATRFPAWLDRNLFDNATLGDLFQPGKPLIWINASDLYNRTPFLFSSDQSVAKTNYWCRWQPRLNHYFAPTRPGPKRATHSAIQLRRRRRDLARH